jgi:heat shock protein HtpX
MNNMKTVVLMGGLTGLLVAVGGLIGNQFILPFFLMAVLMNLGMWFFSDQFALSMMRAREVDPRAPAGADLYRMVDDLRQRAGLPMPRVYVCPHEAPNAFATGRSPSRSAVAVTEGLLRLLDRHEIEGVIAHELAHIKNRDMLISTIAAGVAGAIGYLPYLIMFGGGRDDREGGHPFAAIAALVIGPIAAMIIQYAVSRQREFEADRVGAEILGRPMPLANALRRLDAMAHQIPMNVQPAAAPLAQVNPLAAHGGGLLKLFSTHPPTAERVARLEALASGR